MPGLYGEGAGNVTVPAGSTSGLYQLSADVNVLQATNYGNANVANYLASGNLTSNIITSGNVQANYFIGDGSQLTNIDGGNIVGGYGNANVVTLLANFGSNTVSTTGNITGGYIFGNGSQLTGLPATYSNANVNAHLAAFGSNTISTTGNVTAGYFIGDGSQLTGLPPTYGNANVATFLPTYTGNLSGGNLTVGNNAQINNDLTVGGTIFGTFAGNISGNLVVPGANTDVIYNNSGNAGASSNFQFNSATNTLTVNGSANVATLNATGNITGNYVFGNAAFMTGIPASYGNANVAAYLPTYSGNIGNTTSELKLTGSNIGLYGANSGVVGQPGIAITNPTTTDTWVSTPGASRVFLPGAKFEGDLVNIEFTYDVSITGRGQTINGNIFGTGNSLVATGNVVAPYFVGNGSQLTNITGANVSGAVANATYATSAGTATTATTAGTVTTNAQPNITSVGTLTSLSVSGNIATGGILTDGYYYANGTPISFAGTYGNANVADFLDSLGSNAIVTSGNITGGNIIGNGQSLTNLPGANVVGAVANATFATSAGTATTASSANSVAGANVTGTVASAEQANVANVANSVSGSNVVGAVANATFATTAASATSATTAGTVTTAAQPNITSVGTLSSLSVSGNIATGGILTNGYYYANGTPVSFGGGGTLSGNMVGNISGVNTYSLNEIQRIAMDTTDGNITFGAVEIRNNNNRFYVSTDIEGNGAISAVGNITGANLIGTIRTASQPNITQIGTLSSLNVTGNISGGNLSLTGQMVAVGNISAADINADNLVLAGGITATDSLLVIGDINADGNIILNGAAGGGTSGANIDYINGGGYARFHGNVTSVSGHLIAGSVVYPRVDGTAGQVLQTYGNGVAYFGDLSNVAIGNITSLSVTGNVTAGGFNTTGVSGNISGANVVSANTFTASQTVSATGNVTGGNVIGTNGVFSGTLRYTNTDGTAGQVLTTYGNGQTYFSTVSGGSGSPGGANTQIQFNNAGAFAGNAAMTFNNTTGNVAFGNLVVATTAPNTSVQLTTGTANLAAATTTAPIGGRIVVGQGYNGNISGAVDIFNTGRISQFLSTESYSFGNTNVGFRGLAGQYYVTLTGNVSSSAAFIRGGSTVMAVGGGASAFSLLSTAPAQCMGGSSGLQVGGGTSGNLTALGNVFVQVAGGFQGSIIQQTGSNVGAGIAMVGQYGLATTTGNVSTVVAFSPTITGGTTVGQAGNVFVYYNPSNTSTVGTSISNVARGSNQYYFLRNDDDVAQCKLGSLRLFNEFRNTATISSGAVTIDKNNGQVQYVDVTADITSITLLNFVRTASDGTNTDQQTDTVTVIFRQDSTGRSITLPTGTGYRYAGGNNLMGTTANAVQMLSITGITNAAGSGIEYLITVSPEFV